VRVRPRRTERRVYVIDQTEMVSTLLDQTICSGYYSLRTGT
jgi:hypothetical protein